MLGFVLVGTTVAAGLAIAAYHYIAGTTTGSGDPTESDACLYPAATPGQRSDLVILLRIREGRAAEIGNPIPADLNSVQAEMVIRFLRDRASPDCVQSSYLRRVVELGLDPRGDRCGRDRVQQPQRASERQWQYLALLIVKHQDRAMRIGRPYPTELNRDQASSLIRYLKGETEAPLVCARCGSSDARGSRDARVRTEDGLVCEECTWAN